MSVVRIEQHGDLSAIEVEGAADGVLIMQDPNFDGVSRHKGVAEIVQVSHAALPALIKALKSMEAK